MDQKTFEYMNQRVILYRAKETKLKKLKSFKCSFESSVNCYVTARIDGNSSSDSLTNLIGDEETKCLNSVIAEFISELIEITEKEMGEI